MKNTVSITNRGVESAGLPSDYQHAIAEYIWNGFDAGASEVAIDFDTNSIDTINKITITDNGTGIELETIDQTFGNFLDSMKKESYQKSSYVHGHKGKGRFAFTLFAGKVKWHSIYKEKNSSKLLEYDIYISSNSKQDFEVDDESKKISKKQQTGTTVTLYDLFGVTAYHFYNSEFKDFLARQFGWFLFLNKERNFALKINGEPILYDHTIASSQIIELEINNEENNTFKFKITFVRWLERIGEKFHFYYLNSKLKEATKELTSYNNNAIDFYHSVYIESNYFDAFNPSDTDYSINIFENNKQGLVFKALKKRLLEIVNEQYKHFIKGEAADKLIHAYRQSGVFPKFKSNKYDQEREKDFVTVVREIYCIEPRIFKNLNKEQQKISLGLINILLDTDERDNILNLIGEIVNMTTEERASLTATLQKTTLSKITKAINLIESRFKVIELLKLLVYDNKKFTKEVPHIQKAVEENTWLLGEQYHLVSANETFDSLLNKYIAFLNGDKANKKQKVNDSGSSKRPDVFICRKQPIHDSMDDDIPMEENVMIELKRPTVNVGIEQIRQIEDYLRIIIQDEQFNSQKRFWKFFVISNKVDKYTTDSYNEYKSSGKRFLVKALNNFEIYALTWDDVFKSFDLRHSFIADRLSLDKRIIHEELKEKGIVFSTDGSTVITQEIIALSNMAE